MIILQILLWLFVIAVVLTKWIRRQEAAESIAHIEHSREKKKELAYMVLTKLMIEAYDKNDMRALESYSQLRSEL